MLAHVLSFGRNPRGSPDFLLYPVPKACMHVLGTGVPRRLGVAHSASSPKAAEALGCSLTPALRISFGPVTCMGLGWVCVGTVCGFAPLFLPGVRGVCGWAWALACTPPVLVGVLGRAWLCARSSCSPPFPVLVCGVGVCAWVQVSAAPRLSLGRCWGVCALVCPSYVVCGTSWLGVRCEGVRLGLGCCRAPPLLAGVLGRVSVCVCAPLVPPFLLGGVCCVGVCAGRGFRPRPVPLGWIVGVCVPSCVCPACPRPSWGAACSAGVCGWCR